MKASHPIKSANLIMLSSIAKQLNDLSNQVVFLGGCTTALFITDPISPDVRYTKDVDCIIDVISLQGYHKFSQQLREIGFIQSPQDDVICRWRYEEILLDVMPTDEKILGFTNRWYKPAIHSPMSVTLPNQLSINVVTPAYFLATKLEAFDARGNQDYLGSHDLEDIISVLDGRPELVNDVYNADGDVKKYLINQLQNLRNNRYFLDALEGHLNYGVVSKERAEIVLDRMEGIVNIKEEFS